MTNEGGVLKSASDIEVGWRGKKRFTNSGFELKKPVVSDERLVGFNVIKEKIKKAGLTYECHFQMDEKTIVFVLDEKNNTVVFLDDGTTRPYTTEEWVKYNQTFFSREDGRMGRDSYGNQIDPDHDE